MIEEIPDALAGERLDRVVSMLGGVSRSAAADLVSAGKVSVNGRAVTARTHRVGAGDEVEFEVAVDGDEGPVADPNAALSIVYEDADVVIVDKPAGLVVHPGAGTPDGTLVNGLLARYPEIATVGDRSRPGIVHRLDKGTSGLLVVARSSRAYEELVRALAAREVERVYLALVWGVPDAPAGMVDAPIGRSTSSPTRMSVSARGKEARTRYAVQRSFRDPVEVSLLECRLDTGRTHQIRVHLAAIGHPVVGDDRYGGARPSLEVPRPFLHAHELRFAHPVTSAPIERTSPLPADLEVVLAALGD